jgi:hypothetical protein
MVRRQKKLQSRGISCEPLLATFAQGRIGDGIKISTVAYLEINTENGV